MKKARRFLAVIASSALVCLLCVSCGSTVNDREETHTGGWWRQNINNHWKVVRRDFTDLYRSVDRHVFNYDWDDPYFD